MQNIYGDQPTEFILYLVFSAISFALIWKLSERFSYNRNYISVIFLGLNLFGLVTYVYGGAYFLSTDGITYVRQAEDIIVWLQDPSHVFQISRWKIFWPGLIAAIYSIFGNVPLVIILLNVIFVTLSAIFVYKTSAVFSTTRPKWSFVALFLINPVILLFAISTGREAVFWLALSIAVFGVSNLLRGNYTRGIWIFLSGALLGGLTRPTLSLPIMYFLILSCVLFIGFDRNFRSKIRMTISVLIAGLIGLTALPLVALLREDTERIPVAREALSRTATTSFQEVPAIIHVVTSEEKTVDVFSALFTDISTSISNFLRASVGPFPQEMQADLTWVVLGIVNCWWIFFLVISVFGLKNNFKNPLSIILICASFFTFTILAWTLTNYGIVIRFRGAVMYLLLPFAVVGISKLQGKSFRKKSFLQ